MRILIITSCTGQKVVKSDNDLTGDDFSKGATHLQSREKELKECLTPASDLYSGQQHVRLMRGINAVKKNLEIDLHIVSAGYGLISGSRAVAPYECTFTGRGKADLAEWALKLEIPQDFRKVLNQKYDLGLLLLGDDYLAACQLDEDVQLGGPTIAFCGGNTATKLPKLKNLIPVPMGNQEAKRFSCGLVGLKGELADRLLQSLADCTLTLKKLVGRDADILSMFDKEPTPKVKRGSARANPAVDHVIHLPDTWRDKPHRKKLRYFIPEWDDLVDPDYDFKNDVHSGGGGDWSNETYAHQMYPEPNYDGILVSKVVAEKSKKKAERINEMGVHRYLRVPREFPVMGDCGAFGYIGEEVPPYSTEEILDYYTKLDFDYGVSIDHLIVSATEAQKKHRYDLTINNAEEFLKEHRKRGLPWTPMGSIQGWDPKTYKEAARQYVAMGYKYLAIGGLVRTPTKEVLRVLEEVHTVVPSHVDMHLFGLARLNAMNEFARLGVRSVDSASFLRRAWMGTGQNYLVDSGELYAAIRIPGASKSYRAKRMVSEGRASQDQVQKLEAACLKTIHEFDRGECSIESTLDTIMEYDHLITPDRPDNRSVLEKTLKAAPWKECSCDICKKDGIDVIVFRGNNRNRRRGFHNTYVFYRILQKILNGEVASLDELRGKETNSQMKLFSPVEVAG